MPSFPSSRLPHIALYGRSGAGKSEVASILAQEYGYQHRSTGLACRRIVADLFGADDKTILNRVADALMEIDDLVWIRAALKPPLGAGPVVLDSIRLPNEYDFVAQQGFQVWHINAPLELRLHRLEARGQAFDPEVDEHHAYESSLSTHAFDVTIVNDRSSLEDLRATVGITFDRA